MHILVNVTSVDPDIPCDNSCCLSAGEHEFITRDSYAAYEFAIERQGAFIDRQVKIGNYIQKADATDALVEKLQAGLKKSPFAKRGIKDGYDKAMRAAERRKKAAE
jgi:hypothetical protein